MREDAGGLVRELEALKESAGWAEIEALLQQRYREGMAQMVATPLSSMDEVLRQEFQKGQLAAFTWLWTLPDVLIEDVKAQQSLYLENPGNNTNDA